MVRLRHRLPPANSLVVFESASRLLNFTRAADELGVTQSAVSRQIRLLEQYVGQPLFNRRERRLQLTERGEKLKSAISIGLNHIADVVDTIARRRRPSEVTVAASVAFSSYWLMSRVAQFRAQHPEIEFNLIASAGIRSHVSDFDLAIRYGRGNWPGVRAEHLFDNDVFPVCAPKYLKGREGRSLRPRDLLDETLLHLSRFDQNWVAWESWFEHLGLKKSHSRAGLSFDSYLVLTRAVVAGEGIALCGGRLAQDMLARGEVVRVTEHAMQSDRAFYLVQPEEQDLNPAGRRFKQWLIDQARAVTNADSSRDGRSSGRGRPRIRRRS